LREHGGAERGAPPAHVVGPAVQNLAAARLARGFVPLAILFFAGIAVVLSSLGDARRGWVLALGAPVAAGAMLAQGLRVVQRAFGRPQRAWMRLTALAALVPPALAFWVIGWLGLRRLADWAHPGPVLTGAAWSVLGAWVLRSWLRIVELERLARTMGAPERPEGGA
jgi:hypothetical protein